MRSDDPAGTRIEAALDAALRSYAEPPAIPEARLAAVHLLQRARELEVRRRRLWAIAVPSVACAILIAVVAILSPLRLPRSPQIAWTPGAPGLIHPPPIAGPAAAEASRIKQSQIERSRIERSRIKRARVEPSRLERSHPRRVVLAQQPVLPLPRLEVFPTPHPLSPQERALVEFAAKTPPAVQRQVLAAEQHIADPINIAELTIRPLDEGEKHPSEKER